MEVGILLFFMIIIIITTLLLFITIIIKGLKCAVMKHNAVIENRKMLWQDYHETTRQTLETSKSWGTNRQAGANTFSVGNMIQSE